MHFIIVILLNLSIIVCVNCYSFNTKDVILISENSVKNTYFSYSLLLQGGETISSLIIRAPKNNNNPQLGGDIYKCDIGVAGDSSCIQYPAGRIINSNNTNGNFFGMSLDGADDINGALVACAPRTVTSNTTNYLRGYCIYMKNTSQITEPLVEIAPLNNGLYRDSSCCDAQTRPYYDFAFAMAGFAVSFDSEKHEVLLGAPGVKKFNGATISYSIDDQGISLLPTRTKPLQIDEDSYFGYSTATAKFIRNSDKTWFIAGAPRSNYLKGKVMIYFYDLMAREKINIVATFYGEEVASYFGASILALDVTMDGNIDLLVGAPMAAGNTWDEGCVYFYKGLNEDSFQQKVKLTGSRQKGSRFGSAIVSLGDFDLDGFNDIAISAPYEDNGRGAVYIYNGSSEGLTDHYSQRLSPIDFNVGNTGVKGFGMGISRGNDIDGNGHNDIAIGAYKSDQVFIVKSYSIIDYKCLLKTSINTITNETEFDIQFCLLYKERSAKEILPQVKFNLTIDLDYRSVVSKKFDLITVHKEENMCKNYQVQIRSTITDILPFQIDLQLNIETPNIIAHGERALEHKIPYSHGCGSDNICVTDLSVELEIERREVVLGLNKQLNLVVKVNNFGEPAYHCEINIEVPDGIALRNQRNCAKSNGKYTCLIDERLINYNQKSYVFDIKDIKPDIPVIEIAAAVTSLFKNKGGDKNKANITIPLKLDSTPYLLGNSVPENMELEIKSNMSDLEVMYQFFVRKTGPSPLKLNIDILLPVIEYNGENILNILEVKGSIDTIQIPCTPLPIVYETDLDFKELSDLKVPLNRTVLLSCAAERCQRYTCQGEYLYNSGQVATFTARTLITAKLLVSKYKTDLTTKDLIALVPVIFQNHPRGRIGASSTCLIFVHGVYFLPLWLYLVAPTIGVILLLLMSYCLYRCHFFDRVYKDKLDQEKVLGSNDISVEEEIFDDVVFRSMEDTKQKEYLQIR